MAIKRHSNRPVEFRKKTRDTERNGKGWGGQRGQTSPGEHASFNILSPQKHSLSQADFVFTRPTIFLYRTHTQEKRKNGNDYLHPLWVIYEERGGEGKKE